MDIDKEIFMVVVGLFEVVVIALCVLLLVALAVGVGVFIMYRNK